MRKPGDTSATGWRSITISAQSRARQHPCSLAMLPEEPARSASARAELCCPTMLRSLSLSNSARLKVSTLAALILVLAVRREPTSLPCAHCVAICVMEIIFPSCLPNFASFLLCQNPARLFALCRELGLTSLSGCSDLVVSAHSLPVIWDFPSHSPDTSHRKTLCPRSRYIAEA